MSRLQKVDRFTLLDLDLDLLDDDLPFDMEEMERNSELELQGEEHGVSPK